MITLPEPTGEQIVDRIVLLVTTSMDEYGKIHGGGQYIRTARQAAKMMGRAGTELKGFVVQWMRQTEKEDDEVPYTVVSHFISIRFFLEYSSEQVTEEDHQASRMFCQKKIQELAHLLRNARSLDFDEDVVEHQFLQTSDLGEDTDQEIGAFHIVPSELQVDVKVFADPC